MKWSKASRIHRINPKKMNRNNLILLLLLAVTVSCSANRTVRDPRDLYGTRMTLPEGSSWIIQERDTTVVLSDRAKIVVYYNAKGCTSCRMNELYSWKEMMKVNAESLPDADLVFIFKSDPDNEEFRQKLISMNFPYPILCDVAGELERNNTLPKNELYHVFLLDRDNLILLCGSPIYNTKLWELYKTRAASI